MLVYAHEEFSYYDRIQRRHQTIPVGSVGEVSDKSAIKLAKSHPGLCDVTGESAPSAHICALNHVTASDNDDYSTGAVHEIPADRMMRPRLSPQKRLLLRQAWRRSRIARMTTRFPNG